MQHKKLIVGGESVFPPSMIFDKRLGHFSDYGSSLSEYSRYYTFGAYYSFKAIIHNISFSKGDYVLLPSYLCPTMVWPFKEAGVKYDFYKIKEGLLPDLDDIYIKTQDGLKLILFVDYFGYSYKDYLKDIVSHLKAKKISVMQDGVQSWLNNENHIYGDFYVNSVRKYSPFEASVLLSKVKLEFKSKILPISRFMLHKRIGQILRYYHIKYDRFKPDVFLKHIIKSNSFYHKREIIDLPALNRVLLDKIDYHAIGEERVKVFSILKQGLGRESVVKFELGDTTPLALPLYIEARDHKKTLLHKNDIHCPIHWLLPDEIDKKEHEYSWDLQSHELSIPLNMNISNLELYKEKVKEIL